MKNNMQENQYDDCAVCQAMKMAEKEGRQLTEAELLRAFREQEQSGIGLVGFGDDLKKK